MASTSLEEMDNSTSTYSTTGNISTTIVYPEQLATSYLWAYLGFAIIVLGTTGHALSIAVMLWSKKMRTQSSTVYLVAMSFAGLVSLYSGLLRYSINIGLSKDDLREDSIFACRFHMMLTYLSLQYFAWLQATVAVDRLTCLLLPHRYKSLCTWRTGLLVTLGELIAVTALNSAVAAVVSHNEFNECMPTNEQFFYDVWGYIDFVSFSLLPASILIICNSMILVLLQKNNNMLKHRSSKSRSLTVMLMSLNVIFLITTIPISVIFFVDWGGYETKRYADTELAWTIFSLLQYAGSACTFLVYCITGSKFREEFLELMKNIVGYRTSRVKSLNTLNTTRVATLSPSPIVNGTSSSSLDCSRHKINGRCGINGQASSNMTIVD